MYESWRPTVTTILLKLFGASASYFRYWDLDRMWDNSRTVVIDHNSWQQAVEGVRDPIWEGILPVNLCAFLFQASRNERDSLSHLDVWRLMMPPPSASWRSPRISSAGLPRENWSTVLRSALAEIPPPPCPAAEFKQRQMLVQVNLHPTCCSNPEKVKTLISSEPRALTVVRWRSERCITRDSYLARFFTWHFHAM